MPFWFRFFFSLSDAEKEGETTFGSFFAEILLVVVVIVVVYSSVNFSSVQRLQIRLSILHAHATFRTRVLISLASEELILMKQLEGGSRRTKRCPPDARAERVIMSDMLQGANPHQRRRGRGWPEVSPPVSTTNTSNSEARIEPTINIGNLSCSGGSIVINLSL